MMYVDISFSHHFERPIGVIDFEPFRYTLILMFDFLFAVISSVHLDLLYTNWPYWILTIHSQGF